MKATLPRLVKVLADIGKPTECLASDHGRLVVLPHGGRLLGLSPAEDDDNFFWTHPALGVEEKAGALFRGDGWPNPGGDRTWLAPERELFISELKHPFDTYRVPPALDPGAYVAEKRGESVVLTTRVAVRLLHADAAAEVEIIKTVRLSSSPLHDVKRLPRMAYAGYTLDVQARLLSNAKDSAVQLGLWNLLQLPAGGDMLIPTFGRVEPLVVFGRVPPGALDVDEHGVRHHTGAPNDHKLSLRALGITGRAGYLYTDGRNWNLVVRDFAVDPTGVYVDTPWNDPSDRGYALQTCNINSTMGRFSELEYHAPAIGAGTGRVECLDRSRVWAFRGDRATIATATSLLLGMAV